jgi:hypothetical protein
VLSAVIEKINIEFLKEYEQVIFSQKSLDLLEEILK